MQILHKFDISDVNWVKNIAQKFFTLPPFGTDQWNGLPNAKMNPTILETLTVIKDKVF